MRFLLALGGAVTFTAMVIMGGRTATPMPADVPLLVQYQYSADAGAADPAFHATLTGDSGRVAAGDLNASVDGAGVVYERGTSRWNVSAASVDRAEPLAMRAVSANANRIDRDLGAATETVIAGPLGIQQLWTIPSRPAGDGPLVLRLTGSDMALTSATDAELINPAGDRLAFGGLYAFDATGRQLPARFEAASVRVDDSGARYPVVIDPFARSLRITTGAISFTEAFGTGVAVSDDGSTIAIGSQASVISGTESPAIFVYTRPANGWSTVPSVAAKLYGTFGVYVGENIAIDSTGSTIVSGGRYNTPPGGAPIGVFVRPVGGWSGVRAQTASLSTISGTFAFGSSLAVSADGLTVMVGDTQATGAGPGTGALFGFQRPGATWVTTTTHDVKLYAGAPFPPDQFGFAASISGDGATIAVGAPSDPFFAGQGAVYLFERPGATWTGNVTDTARLTVPSGVVPRAGSSVDLTSDGRTLVVGGCGANSLCQFAAVFTTTGTWTAAPPAAYLSGSPQIGMGRTVAIGNDGKTVLFAGRDLNTITTFSQPAGGWTGIVSPDGQIVNGESINFGNGRAPVAMSGNSNVVVLGLPTADFGAGAGFVWVQPRFTGFSPTSGRPGDVITFTGTDLYAAGDVSFGGVAAFNVGPKTPSIFTATVGAGASGQVAVKVDNATVNLGAFTFIQGGSTTAITNRTPAASAPGQSVSVSYAVTTAIGTPTGVVSVTASTGEVCTASPAAGACSLTFFTQGDRTLIATYLGTNAFTTSVSSPVVHSVKLPTAVSITGISSNAPPTNVPVLVSFTVGGSIGTPTGTVTITANSGETCTAQATAGQCLIIFTTEGPHTLTATYAGNSAYFPSTSPTFDVTSGRAIYRQFVGLAVRDAPLG